MDELFEVTVEFICQTTMAIQVDDGTGNKVWIPKSQVKEPPNYDDLEKQEVVELLLPTWLAMDKGLI